MKALQANLLGKKERSVFILDFGLWKYYFKDSVIDKNDMIRLFIAVNLFDNDKILHYISDENIVILLFESLTY